MTDVLPLCRKTIVGGVVCKAELKVVVVEMVKLHAVGEKESVWSVPPTPLRRKLWTGVVKKQNRSIAEIGNRKTPTNAELLSYA